MAKISKRLDNFLVGLQQSIQTVALTKARVEANDPTLPSWSKSADWYDGLLQGKIAALEGLLDDHGIYQGYNDITETDANCGVQYTYPHYFRGVRWRTAWKL